VGGGEGGGGMGGRGWGGGGERGDGGGVGCWKGGFLLGAVGLCVEEEAKGDRKSKKKYSLGSSDRITQVNGIRTGDITGGENHRRNLDDAAGTTSPAARP